MNAPDRECLRLSSIFLAKSRLSYNPVTVCIAGILALGFAYLVPPFQFNDEHAHFFRAYQLSRGEFVGHEGERIPAALLAFLQRYPDGYRGHTKIILNGFRPGPSEANEQVLPANGPGNMYLLWGVRATRMYCPIVYLPAAAGILIARALNMPPLAMLYAARTMNVLGFLAALWWALILAPDCRVLLTVLALMPMTLHQAAAISADQVTIALSMVGIALILHAREAAINKRYLAAVLVVFVLLILSKNSYWALPLLLLVPARQLGGRSNKAVFITVVVAATLGAEVVWSSLCHDSMLLFQQVARSYGIDPQANGLLLARHPLNALAAVFGSSHFLHHVGGLVRGFVAVFGWEKFSLPVWTHTCYFIALLAVAFLEPISADFSVAERLLLALVCLGALIGTYCVLFIVDGIYANGQYSFWSAGVQGRYLIPYSLVGLLALKQSRLNIPSVRLARPFLAGCTFYAVASLLKVVIFYYGD